MNQTIGPHADNRRSAIEQAEQVPAWLLDLLLGVAVTLVIALVITADQGGSQEPDWIAYAFAAGFGGLMLVRRHLPVVVLVATMFLLFVYYALGYPAIGLAVPVSAALYSAAELGRLPAAIVVSLLLLGVSTYFRLHEGQSLAFVLGYELISYATMMAAALALGDSMRSRRALRAEQAATAQLIAQEHTLRAEQRVQAERVRMARELHDVIGHSISVISLHADVAREAIGHNDEGARQALRHIRTATGETMRDLHATVKFLRNAGEAPHVPWRPWQI
ncbi:MAG: histidine kinase dimerization/phosphoacceptor domain-containing protein [Caldilineaceae bacterium]